MGQRGDVVFERLDFGAENEELGIDDPHDGGDNFIADRRMLCTEIQQRNGH